MFENEKPFTKDKLNDLVYDRLCTLLREGEFIPGKAVAVSRIAEAFGVSAMPVREALMRLAANGVLANVSGRSVGVPSLDLNEMKDLRDVRLEVEPLATKWATQKKDKQFLNELDALLVELQKATDVSDHKNFVKLNYKFHFRIYEQAQSPTLLDIIETLWLRVSPHLYFSERERQFKVSNVHHKRVVEMIRIGDENGAALGIHNDLTDAYNILISSLRND